MFESLNIVFVSSKTAPMYSDAADSIHITAQRGMTQSCKKRETLHDPEICIENFTRDFTSTLFPKITKCPSKAKNYHTTKKK